MLTLKFNVLLPAGCLSIEWPKQKEALQWKAKWICSLQSEGQKKLGAFPRLSHRYLFALQPVIHHKCKQPQISYFNQLPNHCSAVFEVFVLVTLLHRKLSYYFIMSLNDCCLLCKSFIRHFHVMWTQVSGYIHNTIIVQSRPGLSTYLPKETYLGCLQLLYCALTAIRFICSRKCFNCFGQVATSG